jgi:uncharacterized membrane protein
MSRFVALCLVLGACSSVESTGIAPVTCPPSSTLTYANFGSAFMTDNCLECHARNEKPTLSTQAQVQTQRTKILKEAVYTNAMPEDKDISIAEREMLGEWIACGAP